MDEIRNKKQQICDNITKKLKLLTEDEFAKMLNDLESRLFNFANFMESNIVLLYINSIHEVPTSSIIRKAHNHAKIVVLPVFHNSLEVTFVKIDDPIKDLIKGPKGILQPKDTCKILPINCVDIAIIPGISMDEKGGRIGSGYGHYDEIIPRLPTTTRKVGLAFEEQITPIVPMEPTNKHVDIIITQNRIIYKI